ncbi:hypothetical protein DAEQUDRAFT_719938 [Daedalea quercina L-15889]|uniref:Uncharacterized protein n=1 Tax=Daedalea quercina L-15889 TaxID=1314783 RepID=A0A165UDK9_9APHY|nr:hypothetical protein DAEQUDRAFT_719938 [Daedalea quercina L-15889]
MHLVDSSVINLTTELLAFDLCDVPGWVSTSTPMVVHSSESVMSLPFMTASSSRKSQAHPSALSLIWA